MTRINIVVEGAAEESFIKNLLAPFFWSLGIYVTPLVLGVPGHKGGNVNYARVKKDILLQLKQDRRAYCSTMFDLYGIREGFPGMQRTRDLRGTDLAIFIERCISEDIAATIPELRPDIRLLPYIQVYEFEGLLFSDPDRFAMALGSGHLSQKLRDIRSTFSSPEEINGDINTAPSKRLLDLYPSYKKVIDGTIAAQAVGLRNMRQQCPHFNNWLSRLESVAPLP